MSSKPQIHDHQISQLSTIGQLFWSTNCSKVVSNYFQNNCGDYGAQGEMELKKEDIVSKQLQFFHRAGNEVTYLTSE